MSLQHTHDTTPFEQKKHQLVVLSDGVIGPANLGGLFRLCDAFGISEFILFNSEMDITSTRLRRTARATETRVPHSISEDILKSIQKLRLDDYLLIGLEITSDSRPLDNINFSEERKIALVIGNERTGISDEVIEALDFCVHIEMFGKNSSMNVTQATAIALYELTKK